MKTEAEQLWYYIVQLRRIAAHREAGAEQSILKIYQGILQKLFGILGQYYTAYGKEDAILTRGDLQAAGQYKNFLQAVLEGLDGIASEVQDEIRQAIEETYTTCYNGMVAAVQKSHAANPELSNLLQGLSATTPETVRHIIEHPMENLTLSTILNRQRKQVVTDIKKTIAVGLANGDSYTRMAQRISDSVGKDYRKAMRIVRTEANRAINRGFQDVSEEASDLLLNSEYVEVKEWCSMEDESVRNTHRHLNGKVIHDLDVFHSKGRTADCPCAFGVPEEDIHCRCFLAYRFMKREEFLAQGGVIPDSVLQKEAELRLTSDEESGIIESQKDSVNDDKIKWNRKGENLNSEQKRELREYAESKGIVLTGYAKTDVDVSLMKKVMDDADSLLQKYPELRGTKEKPFTLKIVNGMEANDFAMTSTGNDSHVIQLNANAFRDEKKLAEEYQKLVDEGWFVKGTTYHSIVIHEMGHMYANVHKIDGFEVAKDILNMNDASTNLYLLSNISEYASQLKSEVIAEVFSSYYGGQPNQFEKDFIKYIHERM